MDVVLTVIKSDGVTQRISVGVTVKVVVRAGECNEATPWGSADTSGPIVFN